MNDMAHNAKQVEALLKLHAALLHDVVDACHDSSKQVNLLNMLKEAESNGWQKLCDAIRAILSGQRDESVLTGLDEEDAILVQAILIGIDNPDSLPPIDPEQQRNEAAVGLASTIASACQGDQRAMELIAHMEQTFQENPTEMGAMGNVIRRMVNGERSIAILIEGLDRPSSQLVEHILTELKTIESQPQKYQPWLN